MSENLTAVRNLTLLLWASKFATAKIECSFEMGKQTPLGVTFILLVMVHDTCDFFTGDGPKS